MLIGSTFLGLTNENGELSSWSLKPKTHKMLFNTGD